MLQRESGRAKEATRGGQGQRAEQPERREEDGSATHKAYDSQKAPYELKAVAAKVFLRANDERQPTVERSGRTARAAPAQRRRAAPTPDLAGEDCDAPAGKLPHCAR